MPKTDGLEPSGARLDPSLPDAQWHLEQLQRYLFAAQFIRPGAFVLDSGAGDGSGTRLLSESAAQVLGVERSAEAVSAARARYASANLKYETVETAQLPLADSSVDLATCFDLEHRVDPSEVVAELARVLKRTGILVISAPTERTGSEGVGQRFDELLAAKFAARVFYRQRYAPASSAAVSGPDSRERAFDVAVCALQGGGTSRRELVIDRPDASVTLIQSQKKHIGELEHAVLERDRQIELLARELLEIKQSGALRLGRALSSLVPSALKQRVYSPLRRSEASAALQALRGRGTVTSRAAPSTQSQPDRLSFAFVVPVYNHARFLGPMIESLCNQTRPADEIILVDDNSPDAAVRTILDSYQGRPGFRVLHNEANLGISETTNRGIRAATSSHLAFVDCDDIVESNALELVEGFLRGRPEVDFVYTNRVDVDVEGNDLQRWDFKEEAAAPAYQTLKRGMFTSHLKVISAVALRDVGTFKARYDPAQDYDLALRLAERRTLGHLDAYVYRHRVHSRQQSRVNAQRQEAMRARIQEDSARRMALREADSVRLVSIVVRSHDATPTKQAIESILGTLRGRFELIVFDEPSDPQLGQLLAGFTGDPRVRVLPGARPSQASGRFAAPGARGDYLLFLEAGIVVDDRDLLVKLVERLEDAPSAGACCCKVVLPDGTIESSGGVFEPGTGGSVRLALVDSGKRSDDLSAMEERECDWLPGGATLWRREWHASLQASEGATEHEELALRARRAGVKFLNCPTAAVLLATRSRA